MRLRYRLRQLVHNISARPPGEAARRDVAALLSPAEQALFARQSLADQGHALRILGDLRAAGYNDPDLLAAALLHDVGKTRYPLTVWDRTVIVVGTVLFSRRVKVWGQGPAAGWRRPFVVRAQHPAWGAEMAAAAGSRAAVVDLIRRHADEPRASGDDALRALQWADDHN